MISKGFSSSGKYAMLPDILIHNCNFTNKCWPFKIYFGFTPFNSHTLCQTVVKNTQQTNQPIFQIDAERERGYRGNIKASAQRP